jgi:hypothetical protein
MTGYGVVASYLGQPDAGLAAYTDMLGRATAAPMQSKSLLSPMETQVTEACSMSITQ